jgi:hypothetical protein
MGFTGVDDPYEPPINPEITLKGYGATPEENARIIVKYLEEQGHGWLPLAYSPDWHTSRDIPGWRLSPRSSPH